MIRCRRRTNSTRGVRNGRQARTPPVPFGQTPFWSDNFPGLRFRRPEAFPGRVVDHRFKGPSFSDSQTVEHNAKPPREPQGAAVWPRRRPQNVQVDAQSTRSGIQGEQCAGASSCTDLDRPSCSLLCSATPLVIISQCKTLHLSYCSPCFHLIIVDLTVFLYKRPGKTKFATNSRISFFLVLESI
jgi:hypothetical protein